MDAGAELMHRRTQISPHDPSYLPALLGGADRLTWLSVALRGGGGVVNWGPGAQAVEASKAATFFYGLHARDCTASSAATRRRVLETIDPHLDSPPTAIPT